jgi:hypothetical protein
MPLATELLAKPGNIRLVDLGYVDGRSVIERLAAFVQGLACNEPQLRQVLLFEFWLRNREAAADPFAGTKRTGREACPT